jgi:hypothetical protein
MSATSKLNIHNIEKECLQHPTSGVVIPSTTLNITYLQHGSLMLGLNMRFRNIQKQHPQHSKTTSETFKNTSAASRNIETSRSTFSTSARTLATSFTNV